MRKLFSVALLLLLLAPLAACGKKAAPSPPGEESPASSKYPHVYPREDPDESTIPPTTTPPRQ